MFNTSYSRPDNAEPDVKANRLINDLRRCQSVDTAETGRRSNVVRFEVSSGSIPPEVSRVLAENDATLYDGCLSNSYHEFRARVK